MTFGIDVSQYQYPLDYAQAKREGVEFVIVKAAGFNTGSLYVAGRYSDHVDDARAAGLPIGHYYVVGAGDPVSQADYFVDHLHGFDVDHDVLALDNEPLDSNGTFWGQDDAYAFLAAVQARTGIPWARLWLYCPASLTRGNPPWSRITSAGIRIWWASYGGNPTGHTPDHTPELDGAVDHWDVHQFTSSAAVAGQTVDGNYSPIAVGDLFSGAGSGTSGTGGGGTIAGEEEEPMSYIKIQGKAGGWRGGTYAVFANGGGAYSAVFIGSAGPTDLAAVTDETAIEQLQQKISGLA